MLDTQPAKLQKRSAGEATECLDRRLKKASIQKKIGWLNAACNFAIKEGTLLRFNPFAGIVKVDDAERRVPLDDTDMKTCKANLDTFSESDQLLFRLLAT